MAYKSKFMTWLEGQSKLMCIDLENSYLKIKVLLEQYKTSSWINNKNVSLSNIADYEVYEKIYGEDRFAFLSGYVSKDDMTSFKIRSKIAVQTKEFSELVQAAVLRVKEYPQKGEEYYNILDMKYMNFLIIMKMRYWSSLK